MGWGDEPKPQNWKASRLEKLVGPIAMDKI